MIVCFATVYTYLINVPEKFESTATLLVSQNTPTQTLDTSVLSVSSQLAETYSEIGKSKPVLEGASKLINADMIDEKNVTIVMVPRTQLIKVKVRDLSSKNAADFANAISSSLQNYVVGLQKSINPESRAVIEIADRAIPDLEPVFPKIPQILILSTILSFILSVLIVYIAEYSDRTIASPEDIENFTIASPVIGTIPLVKVESDLTMESFREIRTNFDFLNPDNPPKTVAIVSTNPGEGKTYISLQLSKAIASTEKRVLIIDADLRKISLTKESKLANAPGLSQVILKGGKDWETLIKKLEGDNLYILPAGSKPANPGELLASKRAQEFVNSVKASKKFETIIIDTPPIKAVSDGANIAGKCDGVLLVVQAHKTTKEQLLETLESLKAVKTNVLGIIINKAKKHKNGYYYGKY